MKERKNTMTIKTEQSLRYFAIPFNSVPEALEWATAHKLYNITVKILSDGTPAIILDKNSENHRKAWNTYDEKKN